VFGLGRGVVTVKLIKANSPRCDRFLTQVHISYLILLLKLGAQKWWGPRLVVLKVEEVTASSESRQEAHLEDLVPKVLAKSSCCTFCGWLCNLHFLYMIYKGQLRLTPHQACSMSCMFGLKKAVRSQSQVMVKIDSRFRCPLRIKRTTVKQLMAYN